MGRYTADVCHVLVISDPPPALSSDSLNINYNENVIHFCFFSLLVFVLSFRSFILSRPSRRKLKQSGILKERVFGCDLGEHLLNSGRESKNFSSSFFFFV